MSAADEPTFPDEAAPGAIRRLLARDGWAVAASAVATIAIEMGVYVAGRLGGARQLDATLAALAASAIWIALAAPVLAAGGADGLSALVRGGTFADASAVTLILLWLLTPFVTFMGAVKVYCTYAAMALAGVSVVCCMPAPTARYAAAVLAAIVLVAALATPFWIGGPLRAVGYENGRPIAACAVYANPFYSITGAVVEEANFVWHVDGRVMYRQVAQINDYGPPPLRWYSSALLYGSLAGILAVVSLARRWAK